MLELEERIGRLVALLALALHLRNGAWAALDLRLGVPLLAVLVCDSEARGESGDDAPLRRPAAVP